MTCLINVTRNEISFRVKASASTSWAQHGIICFEVAWLFLRRGLHSRWPVLKTQDKDTGFFCDHLWAEFHLICFFRDHTLRNNWIKVSPSDPLVPCNYDHFALRKCNKHRYLGLGFGCTVQPWSVWTFGVVIWYGHCLFVPSFFVWCCGLLSYNNCFNRIFFSRSICEVVKNFGLSLKYGNEYIYQSMPRMLTLWLDYATKLLELEKEAKADKKKPIKSSTYTIMQKLNQVRHWRQTRILRLDMLGNASNHREANV